VIGTEMRSSQHCAEAVDEPSASASPRAGPGAQNCEPGLAVPACYAAGVATISKADLLKLDVATRLELIEELWDSIASDDAAAAQLPLTEGERALLDDRLREYRADPESGQSWAEVRAEILNRR
jgi:putative addiction module component (TIGR02574 family)